jgi:HlyD family secretion protein
MKISLILLLSLGALAHADTLEIKPAAFSVRPSFTANVIPEKTIPISIPAKEWTPFTITEIAAHGSKVEAGQVLVKFDDEAYRKKLRDAESAATAGKLTLANAEADFASAEKYLPMQLQSARIKASEAGEAWDYFRNTRRDAEITEANANLRQSELRLESEREELKQLEKMYKADDLTENTEEIILKRQRETVKYYEIALDLAKLTHKRQLEVLLPREAITLEREAQSTAIALKEHEQNLPRNFELKRIALEDARVAAKRAAEALATLQAEKDCFVLSTPTSGYFYYGTMQDGRWVVGETTKALAVHAPVAAKRPFAVVVPADAPMLLEATVEESVMRLLKVGEKGFGSLTGRADISFPLNLLTYSPTPGLDGRYRVTIRAEFPKDVAVTAGITASVRLHVYENKSALTVPTEALSTNAAGEWEVESEDKGKIPVKRGLTWNGKTEILSGLSAGMKIKVPGK